MKCNVYLIDVTNRDGVQTSRILLPKLAKTMLNLYLDEMGIYQSEVGFPTLKHEVNYINANLELAQLGVIKRIKIRKLIFFAFPIPFSFGYWQTHR